MTQYIKNNNNCVNDYESGSDYFKNFKYTISKQDEDRGVTKYFYVSVYDEDNNVSNTKFEKAITKNREISVLNIILPPVKP